MSETKALILGSVTTNVERRFWATPVGRGVIIEGGPKEVTGVYSIFIFDMVKNEIASIPGLDPAERTNYAVYQFPMAPQQYEVNEPSSSVITPTQNGGQFLESHGSIYKDIRIGGTVGFRPNPVTKNELIGGLKEATSVLGGPGISVTTPSFLQKKDPRGLDKDEATGFDDIIFLRNIFRAYWDSRKSSEFSRRWSLVWTYAKEQESYMVEPINFTTTRDSSKPLSWNYQIQLRSLYPMHYTFQIIEDQLGFWGSISNAIKKLNQTMRDIARLVNQMATLTNYVLRLPFNIVDGIIGGAVEIMSALSSFKNLGVSNIPKDYVKKWNTQLQIAHTILGGGAPPDVPNYSSPNWQVTQEGSQGQVRKIIRDLLRKSEEILNSDFLWTQPKQVTVSDYAQAYLNEYGEPPSTSGSPLTVSNISIPQSASQETILGGENIRTIAKRLLGDEARWKQLVILNSLRPPYISAIRSTGVLAFGDPILVPKNLSEIENQSGVALTTNTDETLNNLTSVMKRYGRDVKLVSSDVGISGVVMGDLAVNQRGDIEVVDGIDNVYQAVMVKFATEQGELATHPTFGAKYPIGTKFPSLVRLQEYSLNTQKTLRQDPRVKEIDSFAIRAEADVISVDAKVSLRGTDIQLPITFAVRR